MCWNCDVQGQPPPMNSAVPAGTYDATRKGHPHSIPTASFEIDGERALPPRLLALRDRPLHTVATIGDDGEVEMPLLIFTAEQTALEFMQQKTEATGLEAVDMQSQPRARLGIYLDLTIWEDINFGGCGWDFDTNTDTSILTNFDLAYSCGFLWWGWRALGTNASSFIVSIGWPYFGFRDRAGRTIGWILSGSYPSWSGYVRDLRTFGWNDRAISITLPGATYP
jgi:hypothetical protein